jgi:hypothetical protein
LKRVNFGRLPYQMQEEDGKAVAAGAAVSKRSKKVRGAEGGRVAPSK